MTMGLGTIVGETSVRCCTAGGYWKQLPGDAAPSRSLHARRAELGDAPAEFAEAAIAIPGRMSRPYAAVRRVSLIVTSPALFVCPAPILISM